LTIYLVAWLSVTYTCPFGWGLLPERIKNFVCAEDRKINRFMTSFEQEALNKLISIGPGVPVMYLEIQGVRSRQHEVYWPAKLEVKKK